MVAAVAEAGGCREDEVRCGKPRGPTVFLAQYPMVAALRIAKVGGIKVGWIRATVELLPDRPLRCHRCLELGHVRARCSSEVSREDRRFRCGGAGHRAGECAAAPNCPLCADKGSQATHVLGGGGRLRRARDSARPPNNEGCPPPSIVARMNVCVHV